MESGFSVHSYSRLVDSLNNFSLSGASIAEIISTFQDFSGECLVCSFSSDWRFSPARSLEIVSVLMHASIPVTYLMVNSDKGHDAFLFSQPMYDASISQFLDNSLEKLDREMKSKAG